MDALISNVPPTVTVVALPALVTVMAVTATVAEEPPPPPPVTGVIIVGWETPGAIFRVVGLVSKLTPLALMIAFLMVPVPVTSPLAFATRVSIVVFLSVIKITPSELTSKLSTSALTRLISILPSIFLLTTIPSTPCPLKSTSCTFTLDWAINWLILEVPDTTMRTGPSSFNT